MVNPSEASSSTDPLVRPLPAEAVTSEQLLAQEAIEKNRLIEEAATLEAEVRAKAARITEDQEKRRLEAARGRIHYGVWKGSKYVENISKYV